MPTIAIYGAGPALGMATARRFGQEGFQVALVARGRDSLDAMTGELTAAGIAAAGFQANIADREAALGAADDIEARFGQIDVLEYSPTPGRSLLTGPLEVDIAAITPLLDLQLLTPIALAGRLLPGMRERDRGGLLFAMGAAAKYPIPQIAAAGIALSGLRSYALTLNAALRGTGVYVGALIIGATIENSRFHRSQSALAISERAMPVVPAEDLAGRLWDLYIRRDRAEDVIAPAFAQ